MSALDDALALAALDVETRLRELDPDVADGIAAKLSRAAVDTVVATLPGIVRAVAGAPPVDSTLQEGGTDDLAPEDVLDLSRSLVLTGVRFIPVTTADSKGALSGDRVVLQLRGSTALGARVAGADVLLESPNAVGRLAGYALLYGQHTDTLEDVMAGMNEAASGRGLGG